MAEITVIKSALPGLRRCLTRLLRLITLGSVLAVLSVSQSGCDALDFIAKLIRFNSEEANGQTERQVQIFNVDPNHFGPNTFLIEGSVSPRVEVEDGATTYRFTSAADFTFTTSDGVTEDFDLIDGDIVIVRPVDGLLTVLANKR